VRCISCLNEKKRLPFDELEEAFTEIGYQLLTREYINVSQTLSYVCPKGHTHTTTYRAWKQENRCPSCFREVVGKSNKHSYDFVKSSFEKESFSLLSEEYKDSLSKLRYRCSLGHEGEVTWEKWKGGQRCVRCSWDKVSEKHKTPFEDIKKAFEEQEYVLLETDFKGRHYPLSFVCPKGHSHSITWNNWSLGHRCGHCSSNSSKGECELGELYKEFAPIRTRVLIAPKEIDLYFEKQKLAIEYCGLYWHSVRRDSEKHKRIQPGFHYNKMKACSEKGVRLITIFEDEWRDKKALCQSRINAALNWHQRRVFARKCSFRELSFEQAKAFLEENHLQGSVGSEYRIGLFFKEELISVMTLGSPARAHTMRGRRVLELKRFASLLNTIVVGGASKLFARAKLYAKANGYEEIKSYCDMRWGVGTVYRQLGFDLSGATKYTPHYTDCRTRWRNQTFASSVLQKEEERAKEKGVYKIYDCGHQTWVYKID